MVEHGVWHLRMGESFALTCCDDHDATPRSRKARALVAWLALNPPHAASRDTLVGLLWSDRARDQGRASLRQCLHELRVDTPALLLADKDRIALGSVTVERGLGRLLDGLDHLDPAFDRWLVKMRAMDAPTSNADRLGATGTNGADMAARSGAGRAELHQESVANRDNQAQPSLSVRSPARSIAPPVVTAAQTPSPPRRRAIAVAAIVVASVTLIFTWSGLGRSPPPYANPGLPVVAILPFTSSPADTTELRAVAARIADDALAYIPGDRAIVRVADAGTSRADAVRGAEWVISGELVASASRPLARARIAAPSGQVLWTQDIDVDRTGMARAGTMLATRIGSVIGCALGGPPKLRPPDIAAMLLDGCDKLDFARPGYNDESSLEALRRLARRAPDDALAHAYYGTGLAILAENMPPKLASEARRKSAGALDRAARLDPRVGETWLGRYALITDPTAFAAQEAALLHGLAVEPNAPHLNGFTAGLLQQVGRGDEALLYIRRARALAPAKLAIVGGEMEIMAMTGEVRRARELADTMLARYPDKRSFRHARFLLLLTERDFAGARAMLAHTADYPGWEPSTQAQNRLLLEALEKPHGPGADALTRQLVQKSAIDRYEAADAVWQLAWIGRTEQALAVARRRPMGTVQLLFDPGSHALLYDPRFPEVARAQGLWAYWSATGRWPDACRDPALPWACSGDGVKRASTRR